MDEKIIAETVETVKAVAKDVAEVKVTLDDIKAAKTEIAELLKFKTQTSAELESTARTLAEYKAQLRDSYGKSGAEDWKQEFGKFIKAAWYKTAGRKHGLQMPSYLSKAADYVVDVDAQGGYLAPTWVANEVNKLSLRHGQIWPLVNKVTVPAGVEIIFPWESALGTAKFRKGATGMPGQGVAGTESGTIAWGADTVRPDWAHSYVKISNEAMVNPGINIADSIAVQLMGQLVRLMEYGIIKGYTGTPTAHTGATAPHNGILYTCISAGTNLQTVMATVTYALIKTFIGECITDHEGSGDTDENYLITTDSVAHVLKGNVTQTGITWGDPAQSWAPSLHGYRLLTSPLCTRTRTTAAHDYIILSPLRKITVAWTGNFSVSFNESIGWESNETYMMVSTHADWSLGNTDMHHAASFTAYA